MVLLFQNITEHLFQITFEDMEEPIPWAGYYSTSQSTLLLKSTPKGLYSQNHMRNHHNYAVRIINSGIANCAALVVRNRLHHQEEPHDLK